MSNDNKGSGCSGCLQIIWAGFLTLIILVFLFSISTSADQKNRSSGVVRRPDPIVTIAPGATDQEKIEHTAKSVYGDNLIECFAGNQYPSVDVRVDGTASSIRSRTNRDALAFAKEIRNIRDSVGWDFTDVRINVYTNLVDVYGNTDLGQVIGFNLTAEAIDRINFDNMLESNIPAIARDWYEHPAMSK